MKKTVLIFGFIFLFLSLFSQESDIELINQETVIEIKNGKLIKNLHFEIQINNRAGEQFSKISIPYSNLVRVNNIEAYIKDSNGRVVKKLKKNQLTEKSSISNFSFYEDDFVKEFTLKHNSYPYTIVYSYKVEQNEFINIVNWYPIINEKIQTQNASLIVRFPIDYEVKFKNSYVSEPIIDTIESTLIYKWKTSYTDIIKHEEFSPFISNYLPSVEIIPLKFYFDKKGTFKDWISFGNWQYNLLDGLNELPESEKTKIKALIDTIDNDKEKIRRLYHFLQDETRYINITIETGGLKPYPASYVAQNKYGDCKALTNYLKSVLDYVGIPSFYAKVYAGNTIKPIDKNFPAQQFNHIILYIPLKDEDIWLDCTSDGAFNALGTFTQNRNAFLIIKDSSRFIRTPSLEPEDVSEARNVVVNYGLNTAKAEFKNTIKGDLYETILQIEQNYNESDKNRILRNYYVEDGFQLIDYDIHHSNRDALEIKFSYTANSQNIYKHYGEDILVSNIAFTLPNIEKPLLRTLPVQIDYPIHKIDTINYNIPEGYRSNKSLVDYSIINKYGAYEFKIYEDSGNVITVKRLLINSGFYPISEYEEFYDFYTQILDIENKTHISLHK